MRFTPSQFKHAEALLTELLRFSTPADAVISYYYQKHRQLGQRDRAFIAEILYTVLRHLRSLTVCCGEKQSARHLLLAVLARIYGVNPQAQGVIIHESEHEWLARVKEVSLKEGDHAVYLDLPDWLYEKLLKQFSLDELGLLAKALNQQATLDLRVNSLKAERGVVLAHLQQEGMRVQICPYSPWGVRVFENPSLKKHPLFLDGSLEVQDEGSQLLGLLLQPRRGERVADFCAGTGGKTLLFGALMRSTGRIYAFDVEEKRLLKMKMRLTRSGLSNVHPVYIDSENDIKVKRLAGKLDRVFIDAPCTGTGTLRRHPDLKWRQDEKSMADFPSRQLRILEAASTLVKKGGRLVYATCSLLEEENFTVVSNFLTEHPEFVKLNAVEILSKQGILIDGDIRNDGCLHLLPHRHNTDGFFAAVLERQ